MSVIAKAVKRKKKAAAEARERELASRTGLGFSQSVSANRQGFPFLKYLVNAMILFCTVFGSIDCLITAFSVELNKTPLIVTTAAAALVFSFMYIGKPTKLITYLAFLFAVIYAGLKYFVIINSGVSSIINTVFREIDRVADLPFLREFTTFYEDEYTARSVAVCVIAVSLMLFINIFVSEKMSPLMVFALSFPLAQTGMYFDLDPSKPAMICLACGWVMVAAVRFTNAYNGLTHKLNATVSVKKHRHRYGFVTDSANVASIAVIWLVFIIIISALTFYAVPVESFRVPVLTPTVRQSTERVVKNFLSYGFSSFFSADRLSDEPGRLSNTSSVSFDGKADLRVTLADNGQSRIYLRSFAGGNYSSGRMEWQRTPEKESVSEFGFTASVLERDFNGERAAKPIKHKISVKLLDSSLSGSPLNVPYFCAPGGDYKYLSSAEITLPEEKSASADEEVLFTYYTFGDERADAAPFAVPLTDREKELAASMKEEAASFDLEVPERNREAVESFCSRYGITKDSPDAVSAVKKVFNEDYEYTLKPGKVPPNEDYINYFLSASMKGYCQHFASAAVMIFRYLGIPARYAEGYVIDSTQLASGTVLKNENADDWIEGAENDGIGIVEALIPDYNRHAWVEIFREGIGWVPVEVTTALNTDSTDTGRVSFFTLLLSGISAVQSASSDTTVPSLEQPNIEGTEIRLGRLFVFALCAAVLAYFVRAAVIIIKRRRSFCTGSGKKRISERLADLYKTARFALETETENLSYREFAALLAERGIMSADEAAKLCTDAEKILFGKEDESLVPAAEEMLADCRARLIKSLGPVKKLSCYFVKIMW